MKALDLAELGLDRRETGQLKKMFIRQNPTERELQKVLKNGEMIKKWTSDLTVTMETTTHQFV